MPVPQPVGRAVAMPILAAIMLLVIQLSPSKAAESDPAALDLVREQRVARIGYRLAQAAVVGCDRAEPMTGMGLHDVGSYAEAYRLAIRNKYDIGNSFGIRFVVPGSAADKAGLRPGDEIVALDGRMLDNFAADRIGRDASPARTELFVTTLREALAQGPVSVTVRRAGTDITTQLAPDRGCATRFVVATDTTLNAWSDGGAVAVTVRLVDFVHTDDELAFVIAHEMEHDILHHAERTHGHSPLLASFGVGAATIKATEVEADRFAVRLMLRAGYDPLAGEAFLRRFSRARGPALALTHPGTERRVALIRAEAEAEGQPNRTSVKQ